MARKAIAVHFPWGTAPAAVEDLLEDAFDAAELGDYETAFKLWLSLADEGNAEAQHSLGVLYLGGLGVQQDFAEAAKWIRKAAEQGHGGSLCNLGRLYATGRGVPQDFAASARWTREAAENGVPEAQNNLALMYEQGWGVAKNLILSHMWWSLAAAQGNGDAAKQTRRLAQHMTPEQVAESVRLTVEWRPKGR